MNIIFKILLIGLLAVLTLGFGLVGLCTAVLGHGIEELWGWLAFGLAAGCLWLVIELLRSICKQKG